MTDVDYMKIALGLAERGRSTARPNPMVGAVAARGEQILGEGYHVGPGRPHAEVVALDPVSDGDRDVTLYVTLEPCVHTGRTPPCVDLLIKKRVSRAVCAMVDPDQRVSGRGIDRLREENIQVEVGLMEEEARRLNEVYVKHRTTGLPFVTLKLAQTLDGRIATVAGDSRWITSEESRKAAHRMRADVDAVIVGDRTVMADDPRLSVRHVPGDNPVKIVLDSRLEVSEDAQIFRGARLVLAAAEGVSRERKQAVEAAGAHVWETPRDAGRPLLTGVLKRAGSEDLTHVLIEGGGEVAASALREGLVDRLAIFIAPKLLGSGVHSVADLGIDRLSDAVCLEDTAIERIGDDLLYTARVKKT